MRAGRPLIPSHARCGFTLLEVILATGAAAVAILAVQSVFSSAVRLRNLTQERSLEELALHRTLEVVQRDLSALMPPGGSFAGELQSGVDFGFSDPLAGTPISPDLFTASGRIDPWSPFGDVQRVRYTLVTAQGGLGYFDLVREASRNLLPTLEDEFDSQVLLRDVSGAGFEFFDGTEWTETWDSAAAGGLPAAARFWVTRGESQALNDDPVEVVVLLAQGAARTEATP
jgi:type II secretion system protein J